MKPVACRAHVVALAAMILGTGCVSRASLSAGHVGCPESEIEISDESTGFSSATWTATCRGRRYFCSQRTQGGVVANQTAVTGSQISCAREEPAAGEDPTEVSPTVAATHVTRRRDRRRGDIVVQADFLDGGFRVLVEGAPARDPSQVRFELSVPRTDGHQPCGFRLLVDGHLTELPQRAYASSGSWERVAVAMPVQLLEQMADGNTVVGRVCYDEWTRSSAARASLREFLTRFRAETTFASAPSPDAGAEAGRPGGGAAASGADAGTPVSSPVAESLPQSPPRDVVATLLHHARTDVAGCASSGVVRATLTVRGDTGRVTQVDVEGVPPESATAECVRAVLMLLPFPRFSRPDFHVSFPYRLGTAAPGP